MAGFGIPMANDDDEDRALRAGAERVAGRRLKDRELLKRARTWSPWRSVASLYLWKIAHWKTSPAG